MTPTTVLVATPSSINRARMAKLIASAPGYEVIATAGDLSETFNHAEIREPDVVIIAEEFIRLDEFPVMLSLFDALGARWILFSSNTGPGGAASGQPSVNLSMTREEVVARMQALPQINRAKRPEGNTWEPAQSAVTYDKLVVIGSSTGGVDALITLLSNFPADCPPTAIVQHTGRGFSDSLVNLLERRCKPNVVQAQEGLVLRPGMVCVAAGIDGHLTLATSGQLRCQVRPGPLVSGHAPSVDMLFRSAVPVAPKVVAAILTGMGQDGAAGLHELHRAGSFTIGQDEASSVVYGMPKAAFERGAVSIQLPIQQIGPEILNASAAGASAGWPADRRPATW